MHSHWERRVRELVRRLLVARVNGVEKVNKCFFLHGTKLGNQSRTSALGAIAIYRRVYGACSDVNAECIEIEKEAPGPVEFEEVKRLYWKGEFMLEHPPAEMVR